MQATRLRSASAWQARLPLQKETKAAKAFPQSDQIGLYLCYLRLLAKAFGVSFC
jgi:hypothetical protein